MCFVIYCLFCISRDLANSFSPSLSISFSFSIRFFSFHFACSLLLCVKKFLFFHRAHSLLFNGKSFLLKIFPSISSYSSYSSCSYPFFLLFFTYSFIVKNESENWKNKRVEMTCDWEGNKFHCSEKFLKRVKIVIFIVVKHMKFIYWKITQVYPIELLDKFIQWRLINLLNKSDN